MMARTGEWKALHRAWRLWARHLGQKVGDTDTDANIVAGIRTFWWLLHVIACFMIIIHNGAKLGWWL